MSTTTEKWTIFGERLKTELERQEMSLRQFAEKAGLTLTTACRYVHSQRTPRATEILKAAKVLGVTCDYMLGLSDDPHKTRDGWAKAGFHELPSAQPDSKETSYTHKALDTISRQAAIRWVKTECNPYGKPTLDFESGKKVIEHLKQMPSAQPETHEERTETHACDCISRQAAIDICNNAIDLWHGQLGEGIVIAVKKKIENLPSAQPDSKETSYTHKALDTISRQAAIDAMNTRLEDIKLTWRGKVKKGEIAMYLDMRGVIETLPSAQPEHRFDEWCTDCKEYDHERHCCPRFNQVIRTTLQEVQEKQKKEENDE